MFHIMSIGQITIFVFLILVLNIKALPVSVDQEKDKQLVLKILDQAHRIYSEAWKVLLSSSSSPASPMKLLSERIKKQKKSTKFAISELTEFKPNEMRMKFEFLPSAFPQAFGDSLTLLNRKAKCEIIYEKNGRIESLNCSDLGQNQSKNIHIEFHHILYHRQGGQILEVKADKYENLLKKIQCISDEPCLHMKVPLEGKIQIIDNRKGEKNESKIEGIGETESDKKENDKKETEQTLNRKQNPELQTPGDGEPELRNEQNEQPEGPPVLLPER